MSPAGRPARTCLPLVLAAALAGAALAAPLTAGPAAPGSGQVTGVVALRAAHPVAAAGVRVTSYLPHVHAELVRGTPAALARLAGSPRVAGVRRDAPVTETGIGRFQAASANGVFAWQGLGGDAGEPDAGAGVTVAVVDTGISDTPALNRASGRLVDGVDTSPLVDGGQPVTAGEFTDGFGHGTFLANLLGGGWVPGSGRAVGVAPAARVVSVKVADDDGRTSLAAVLAGLDWAASHRPIDVISLALAAEAPSGGYGADPLALAVHHLRAAGLTVVASAGNQADKLGDPGFDPYAITVGAADTTSDTPTVAPFSGSGVVAGIDKPDLLAPGVHLLGLLPADSVVAHSFPDAQQEDGFWRGSGTSEATAIAAGAAALYLSAHPAAGPLRVKTALRAAATPVAGGVPAGAGLLTVPAGGEPWQPGVEDLDRSSWWAAAWGQPGWVRDLDSFWTTGSWSAGSWGSDPWAGDDWAVKSWSVKSWSVKSWSSATWSVKSWSVKSWSGAPDAAPTLSRYADLVDGDVGP